MIKTVFTATSLLEGDMPGYIPCFGLEMINSRGESVILGVQDIIASDYTWQTIANEGLVLYPLMRVTHPDSSKEGILLQFVIKQDSRLNVFSFENTILALDDELIAALANRQTQYTPEQVVAIRDRLHGQIMTVHQKYLDKTLEVRANINTYLGENNPLQQYQQQYFPAKLSDVPMLSPEDTLSLKIPFYSQLRNIYYRDTQSQAVVDAMETDSDGEAEDMGSERTSAFSQFNLGTEAPAGMLGVTFFEDLEPDITLKHFPVGMGFPYFDSYRYAQCSLTSGIPYVLGNIVGFDENNEAAVPFPNEEVYYRGLQGLIRQGLQEENDLLSIDEVDAAIASGRHSKFVDRYLQDMSRQAFALGRRHTGHVTFSIVSAGGDSDSEDNEEIGLEVQGMYTIEMPKGSTKYSKVPLSPETLEQLQSEYKIFDGFEPLKSYVENYGWGADVWAKVLIILLRFGSRKPRLLHVSGKDPTKKMYFDLEQSKITERNTNKASWKPKLFDDGSEYEFYGFINWKGHATDMQSFRSYFGVGSWADNMSMPIGVVLAKYYEGISDPEFTFVDLFTFIQILKQKRHKISGVSFNEASDTPITINVEGDLMDLSVTEMKGYLNRNSDMVILYVNMDLKMQYNRLAQGMKAIVSKPPEVSIQNYNLFNIVDELLQANPLSAYMELSEIIGSTDSEKISALVAGNNITQDRAHLPIINYVAIEKTSLLLSITEELYNINLNPNMWTPSQILNIAYNTIMGTPKGKNSRVRQEDSYRRAFKEVVKKVMRFAPLMKGTQCVGFVGSAKNAAGQQIYCVWVHTEWEMPPKDKIGGGISMDSFMKNLYSKYIQFKNTGRLEQLVNRQLFLASATTMETLAKLA